MKDHEVVKIAKRIESLQSKISDLIEQIKNSDHPNAIKIANSLTECCFFYDNPPLTVRTYLTHKERWKTKEHNTLYHEGATNAVKTRKARKK